MNSRIRGDAMQRRSAILRRSLPTAMVVGTILTAVNQSGAMMEGTFRPRDLWKVAMNFLVPLSVATYSRMMAEREHKKL